MQKKTIFRLGTLMLALVLMISSLSGISAYFTDTDEATNTFKIGEVNIELQEPNWPGVTDTNPNQTTAKDPRIYNSGVSDAYVYLEVLVPYQDDLVTANPDGTRNDAARTELFTYTINPGWIEIPSGSEPSNGVVKHVYAYVGDDVQNMEILSAGETTPTLFDEITFVNAVEGQGLENSKQDVVVNAYAIQTNDINGGKTDPHGVWEVITNTGIADQTTTSYNIQFGQPYVLSYREDDADYTHEVILYEDGSFAGYSAMTDAEGTLCGGEIASTGSCEYFDGYALLDGETTITIGENGESLMWPNGDTVDTCVLTPVQPHGIFYGETYVNYTTFKPTHRDQASMIMFNNDGSGAIMRLDSCETFPSGTVEDGNPWFRADLPDSDIYPYHDSIFGHVYPDGTKILVNDEVYVLRSILEEEFGCIHINTEIRNADHANNYRGQLWCLDCDTIVRDLGPLNVPS